MENLDNNQVFWTLTVEVVGGTVHGIDKMSTSVCHVVAPVIQVQGKTQFVNFHYVHECIMMRLKLHIKSKLINNMFSLMSSQSSQILRYNIANIYNKQPKY